MIQDRNLSLSNQVYEKIEESILSGTYQIGEVISEKKLCADLGVSRTPVREALSRLKHDKLVRESTTGTVVVGVTKKDLQDFFEIKKRVESLVFQRALENISEEGLETLKEIIKKQEYYAREGNTEKVCDLDTDFHDKVYAESGSIVLEGILSPVHHKMARYRKASLEKEKRVFESVKEHQGIYEALASRDYNKLEERVKAHIENAYKGMTEGSNQWD